MESAVATNASLARDLLLVVPRLAQRAGSFLYVPEAMDHIGKIWGGGSMIADATGQQTVDSLITNTSLAAFAQSTAASMSAASTASGGAWREGAEETTLSVLGHVSQAFGRLKNFGGIFTYLTSKWALATFVAAIVLNRTQFYASSRQHLRIRWHVRLALYAIPITAFLVQTVYILQAMRCQTSPDFAALRYGDPLKRLVIDFAGEGGILYRLSSTLLFWQDDASSCRARRMSLISADDDRSKYGSMSMLFRFFLTLCTSQLFETLFCALQGRRPMPETGMTIFEHSLAFAESEAMISSALGFGLFGVPSLDVGAGKGSGPLVSRTEVMQRLNVPPEVLLVCLISCFSHLSSATLAVAGIRDKVRLINTGIWSCCYMSALIWSFLRVVMRPVESITDLGVLRFPTVCIVGFVPHLLVLIGIVVCGTIYSFAFLITLLSAPDDVAAGTSFRQRLDWAYHNLQANVHFSSSSAIRIRMSEDFYTTLLKIGFTVLTAASEAVYLNEGSRIQIAQMTWVEQKRIDQLADGLEQRKVPSIPPELLGEGIARGLGFVDVQHGAQSSSPYTRERKSTSAKLQGDRAQPNDIDNGLGITQRRSRMQLTFEFVAGIFWLLVYVQAQLLVKILSHSGIERRPAWLLKAAGQASGGRRTSDSTKTVLRDDKRDFWMMDANTQLTLPADDDVDVEVETRRRLQYAGDYTGEESLSDHLYSWWSSGGWYGNVDNSGEYQERDIDDDMTSMISMSTNASTTDDLSDEEESGRRTPTQEDPYRDSTPAPSDGALDISLLSRLLNPQSASERKEARLLSFSLQSSRPMTRSQYRRETDRGQAKLLSGLRKTATHAHSAEEEERDLEHFILAQRSKARVKAVKSGTWESGAEGMGPGGPQCVVCQSAPRTVLVWPCGCLSACDDCRVGLAARNYSKCICCRTDIAAYSRLYVP